MHASDACPETKPRCCPVQSAKAAAPAEPAEAGPAPHAPEAQEQQPAHHQQQQQPAPLPQAQHPAVVAGPGGARPLSAGPQPAGEARLGGWADPAAAAAAAAAGYGDLDVIDLLGDESDGDADLLPLGQLARQQHAGQPPQLAQEQQPPPRQQQQVQHQRQAAAQLAPGAVQHMGPAGQQAWREEHDQLASMSQVPLATRRQHQQQHQQQQQSWHGQDEHQIEQEAVSYSQVPLAARRQQQQHHEQLWHFQDEQQLEEEALSYSQMPLAARRQGQVCPATMPAPPSHAAHPPQGEGDEAPSLSQVPLAARKVQHRHQREQRACQWQVPAEPGDAGEGDATQPLPQTCFQQHSQPRSFGEDEKENAEEPSFSQMPLAVRLQQRRQGVVPAPAAAEAKHAASTAPRPELAQRTLAAPLVQHQPRWQNPRAKLQPAMQLQAAVQPAMRQQPREQQAVERLNACEDEEDVPLKALKERRKQSLRGAGTARGAQASRGWGTQSFAAPCAR